MMNMMSISIFLEGIYLASLFLSTVYVIGVVWRVEGELDLSYKFLTVSITTLLCSEVIHVFSPIFFEQATVLGDVLRVIFGCTFLTSIFLMRDVVRKEDGELEKPEIQS